MVYTVVVNDKLAVKLKADSAEEAEREVYDNYSGIVSVRALTDPEFIHKDFEPSARVTSTELKRFSYIYENFWREVSEAKDLVETAENQVERLRALLRAAEVDLEQSKDIHSRRLDRAKAWNEFLGIPPEED